VVGKICPLIRLQGVHGGLGLTRAGSFPLTQATLPHAKYYNFEKWEQLDYEQKQAKVGHSQSEAHLGDHHHDDTPAPITASQYGCALARLLLALARSPKRARGRGRSSTMSRSSSRSTRCPGQRKRSNA
jgi:hypothetical protein